MGCFDLGRMSLIILLRAILGKGRSLEVNCLAGEVVGLYLYNDETRETSSVPLLTLQCQQWAANRLFITLSIRKFPVRFG